MTKYSLFLLLTCLFSLGTIYSYGDYYIDRITGKQLGADGSETNNLRVIDKREWDYVIEEKGGINSVPGIRELHKNSYVINFDENQIQKEIQVMTDDTMNEGLENQVFIVLNVNNGEIFAIRDWIPELKTNKEIIINTYGVGPNSAPRVGEGLMLLGQIHGHPKEMKDDQKNIRSVSRFDVEAAKELGITIFAIDAFHYHSKALHIHGVTKEGQINNFIGQTLGRNGVNTFSFSNYFDTVLRTNNNPEVL